MTTDDFADELYRNYDWRFDEVRRLENIANNQPNQELQEELRKSVILVLYAHFEGFCIFALEHYQTTVNSEGLACDEVIAAILAGSWEKLFNAMQHGDEKCEYFKTILPNDKELHRHWRRRHFIEEMDRLFSLPASIPDDVIDSNSNLNSGVLKRNLFVLGLDHRFVDTHSATMDNFLKRRNAIAHGDQRRGVQLAEYDPFSRSVFDICYNLIDFLIDAHRSRQFAKPIPEYQV